MTLLGCLRQAAGPRLLVLTGFAAWVAPAPLSANIIVIDGPPAFEAQVQACLERLRGIGGNMLTLIDQLDSSPHEHRIQEDPNGGTYSTSYDVVADANSVAAGGTGNGTGTKVKWDPDQPYTYYDGVVRDPCGGLYHELRHSLDGDQGTRDPRRDPATNIKRNEITATRAQNEYRNSQGLEQRTTYGSRPLPASAIIP